MKKYKLCKYNSDNNSNLNNNNKSHIEIFLREGKIKGGGENKRIEKTKLKNKV